MLVDALGLEPRPELRRLHEAILRQDPALELAEPEAVGLPPQLDRARPLVGRDTQLDQLRAAWRSAKAGRLRLVLLLGPRRMGKTRLAAALAAEALRDGARVLYAAGGGPRDATRPVLEDVRAVHRPTVLVLDEVDRASAAAQAVLGSLDDRAARVSAAGGPDGRARAARGPTARRRDGCERKSRSSTPTSS